MLSASFIESVYLFISSLMAKKKDKEKFFSLSLKVTLTGFKPVTS